MLIKDHNKLQLIKKFSNKMFEKIWDLCVKIF